jgi:transcriptional regulator with XRE-family HTH domain
MKIGFILGELRSIKRATQQEIAGLLNVERSTYSKWENDKITVNVNRLQQIADLYGLTFEYLSRCIQEGEIISKNDAARFIKIAEEKAKKP